MHKPRLSPVALAAAMVAAASVANTAEQTVYTITPPRSGGKLYWDTRRILPGTGIPFNFRRKSQAKRRLNHRRIGRFPVRG